MILGIQAIDQTMSYADKTKPDGLPWEKGDLDWFKCVTNGHILVVGTDTAKTLPPLKNRTIWTMTRTDSEMDTAEKILNRFANESTHDQHLFIAGGAGVWEAFRPYYDAFYTTIIPQECVAPENSKVWLPTKDQRHFKTVIIQPNRYAVTIVDRADITKFAKTA